MDFLFSLLAVLLILNSILKYVKAYNLTKDCHGVTRISNSKWKSIGCLGMSLVAFFTNSSDINFSMITLESLLEPSLKALPWLLAALSNYDYNFITSNGIIIKGKKYDWSQITRWSFKENHYNVIVFEVLKKKAKDTTSENAVETIELNISKNFSDELENHLRQFLGEKGVKSYYFNSF